ncbi:MAG: FeoB-associated Cys-rich membrane protein [Clostridiaceae bacterium]|nr:FeoB-associated Cys-rich membrane protein [Clostridiaceae bacterium]
MATLIVGLIVFAIAGFAAYSVFKNNKKGSCGCGCSGCAYKDNCNS